MSSKGLRVGVDSLVYAPHVATMSEGIHDGVVELEAMMRLGEREDAEQVLVFRVKNSRCVRVFTACDHAFRWCTVPKEVEPRGGSDRGCDEGSGAAKLHFARDDDGLRVTEGDASEGGLLYPFPHAAQ